MSLIIFEPIQLILITVTKIAPKTEIILIKKRIKRVNMRNKEIKLW